MPQISLPYLGSIDSDALENYYDTEIRLAGHEISLELYFSEDTIELSRLAILNKFLNNLEEKLSKTKEYISENYHDEDAEEGVRLYFEFHKDEDGEEEFNSQLGINNTDDLDEQLLNKLNPVSIGLHPEDHNFATFDYSIGRDYTNHLVVVNTDEDGDLINITIES